MPSAVSAAAEKNRRMAAAFTSFVLSLHRSLIPHFVTAGFGQVLDKVRDKVSTCSRPLPLQLRRPGSARRRRCGRSRLALCRNLELLANHNTVGLQIVRIAQ